MICPNHSTSNTQFIHDMLLENTAFWLPENFFYRPAAAAAMKHHRVACLCEVSPYSEQYSQSLPLYKSETLRETSLLHVFLLSFQSPHLPNPISFQILTWISQITETQNPEMHGHLWNADVYKPNPLVYTYMCVGCCLLLHLLLPLVKLCYCSICTAWWPLREIRVRSFGCIHTTVDWSNSNWVLGISTRCPVCLNKKKNKSVYREYAHLSSFPSNLWRKKTKVKILHQ